MGCDIHCYVEYRKRGVVEDWRDFGGRINPGRNYNLFGRMAGVRRDAPPVVPPRGLPADVAFEASSDWWLYISEEDGEGEGNTTPARAQQYHEQYGCKYRELGGKPRWVEGPDWHTPSWLTTDEFALAIGDEEWTLEYRALLAAMQSFEKQGQESRIVFWFDN